MFHTYVTASSGRRIDLDRAALLMDKALLAKAEQVVRDRVMPVGFNPFDLHCAEHSAGLTYSVRIGYLWRNYCALHREKYGEDFLPDVSDTWDG